RTAGTRNRFDASDASLAAPSQLRPSRRHSCKQIVEQLWSRAVATARNPRQTRRPPNRLGSDERQSPATSGNPPSFDGKEGVDGSSPSEGSEKFLQVNHFLAFHRCRERRRRSHLSTALERTAVCSERKPLQTSRPLGASWKRTAHGAAR